MAETYSVAGLKADGHATQFEASFTQGNLVIRSGRETVATISYQALPRPCALNAMCRPPAAPRGVFVDLPRQRVFVSRCPVTAENCSADALFEVKLPGLEARQVGTVSGSHETAAALSPSTKQLSLVDWNLRAPTLFVIDLSTETVRKRAITRPLEGTCVDETGACRFEVASSWADEQAVSVSITYEHVRRVERVAVSSMTPVAK